jgi:hypothetical protein
MLVQQPDDSLRFVLPEDAAYLKNLAALWAVDPRLAEAIEATDAQPSYPCELSKSGAPTACIKTSDGRDVCLHSKYEPLREAEALIAQVPADERFVFFIHGFALGYHVELLARAASEEAILCILEPDLLMLRTALERRDFSDLLETGRVLLFTKLDKSELFVRLANYTGLLSVGCEVIEHAPSVSIAPEFHAQFRTWIAELRDYSRTAMNTLILNGRRTAENITRNIAWYVASPSLSRLEGRHKGKPAIVVSAGPSLRKNKHLLKEAAGRAVLIAVQTTFQPLVEMGVEPQFVTSLDYHEICARFFEKLPSGVKTELVAEPKATDRIFELNPGPVTVLGNDYAEGLLAEMHPAKGKLAAGATVAHLAYYLAEHLGCDPIIFVGQDLGFSDGLCYTPGTSYEDVWRPELSEFCTTEMKQWEQIVRDRPILRQVPDQQGRAMYTEERLFAYLQQFERDFARSGARIIDASEGGVLKRGATVMTLAEAIERFCGEPLAQAGEDHPGLAWDRVPEAVECLKRRREEAGRIEQIARQTLPLLEEIAAHLDDQKRVNKAIARIDVLRAQMDSYGRCYDLITQLTQFAELQRFERDRKLAASRATGSDRQRRQVERDIDNVKSIIGAAEEFGALMAEVIEKLGGGSVEQAKQLAKEAA